MLCIKKATENTSLLPTLLFQKEKIDIMFVPYFDFSETSKKSINEVIKPKYIIAMHIPPEDFKTESGKFLNAFPGSIVLRNETEVRIFEIGGEKSKIMAVRALPLFFI